MLQTHHFFPYNISMKVNAIPHTFNKDQYNLTAPHPLQSWQWGEARTKMGIEVLRVGEFEKEELKNVFQVTFHHIPKTSYKIGYLPRSVWPSEKTLQLLYDYGIKHNVLFFKLEPDIQQTDFKENIHYKKDSFTLVKSPHPLFPIWTQVMDLHKSEEDMLKDMHSKTRYNIRLATKKGVTVKEESTDEGFETFSKLYFETTKRQKYFGHTKQYHQIVWETMKEGIAHILIAYYEGKPLAAYELFYFNNTFYYPYGGSSDKHRNIMAANAIMWEAIRLGKKLGATTFDMWGSIAPDYDKNDPWAGFTRFKEGYGSKFVQMAGSYDLVVNPLLYKLYGFAHIVRNKLLSLKV